MENDAQASAERPVTPAICSPSRRIRWIVYFHLASVAFCLALTLADRGLLVNHRISRLFYATAEWPFLVGLLALPICPLLMFFELVRTASTRRTVILAVSAEALLCMAHAYVLLPACM